MPSPLASLENNTPEINIRSPRYYIARAVSTCWHCGSPTAMVGIAVPPGHETLDVDADASDEDSDGDAPYSEHTFAAWSVADHNAFLFYIDFLPAGVQNRINRHHPAYRPLEAAADPAIAPTAGGRSGSYWVNHCEICGGRLDDHELFCEPEGAFLPTSASAAAAIRLVPVDEPFAAFAAGYSHEPPFFDAMIRG